jgi:uncharacterized membrane protein YraQ (UPF0718 family)
MNFFYTLWHYLEGTYTLRIIQNFILLFIAILPYLIISILINVAAVRFFRNKKINFSHRNEIVAIILGALIGLVSPMPTYAAIPVAVSLMAGGLPFSAALAFSIASPLMNPSIFFLTATQMGMEMALARTITAFLIALTAGILVMKLIRFTIKENPQIKITERPDRSIGKELYRNALYTLKTFSIAILLSSIVKSLVPAESVQRFLGGNTGTGTLLAIGMGIPFYTCGGAAIPFIQSLMELGMSKGAVLAFFIAGPATKIETLYAYKTYFGYRALIFYLLLTIGMAFVFGTIYSILL